MTEPFDPYSAPRSSLATDRAELAIAGRWQRFFNLLIDTTLTNVLGAMLGALIAFSSMALGFGAEWVSSDSSLLVNLLLTAAIQLAYYVPQEAWSGRTLGKLVTGTRAVRIDGGRLTVRQCVLRTLCRFIPFEVLSIFQASGMCWHDTIPDTLVIRDR